MKKTLLQILAITLLTYSTVYGISLITKPYTFVDGTKAEAGKVNADFDTAYTGINAAIGAINTAAGTKSSLDARLDYALNEDGTFKNMSGVTASTQWTNPAFAFQYSSSTKFLVAGNQTDIYLPYRRVKANLAGGAAYSEVSASSYNSGNSKTHITLADAVLTDPITSIEHSIVTPITSNNSAISSRMVTGYIPASTNTASTLVLRDASGNFSAGTVTGNLTGNVTGNVTGNLTGTASLASAAVNTSGTGNIVWTRYENNIRIVRGNVDSDGTILFGSGFTVSKIGTGLYTVTYTDAFSATPTTVATGPTSNQVGTFTQSAASTVFNTNNAAGASTDSAFNFIAIGPN